MSRPVLTTLRLPNFSTNLALDGAAIIIVNGIGSMRTPASRAEYPSTSWRYWVRRKNVPNMAKNTRLMAAVADENVGFLKKPQVEHRVLRPQLPGGEDERARRGRTAAGRGWRGPSSRGSGPR